MPIPMLSEERTGQVRKLAARGLSHQQIAEKLRFTPGVFVSAEDIGELLADWPPLDPEAPGPPSTALSPELRRLKVICEALAALEAVARGSPTDAGAPGTARLMKLRAGLLEAEARLLAQQLRLAGPPESGPQDLISYLSQVVRTPPNEPEF